METKQVDAARDRRRPRRLRRRHPARPAQGRRPLVVEREYMGGVCLNVGCIPSKALINAAKIYDKTRHADDIGIIVEQRPTLDMAKLQTWKDGVVNKLTGGVAHAAQGQRRRVTDGRGQARPAPTTVEVDRPRTAARDDRGQEHRPRDRLAPDRDPGLQVRRQPHHRLDRRARASTTCPSAWSSSAAATSASSSAWSTPSSARKVTVVEALPSILPGDRQGLRRRSSSASSRRWASRCMTERQGQVGWSEQGRPRGRHRRAAGRQDRDASTPTRSWSSVGPPPEHREPRPRGGRRQGRQARLRHRRQAAAAPTSPGIYAIGDVAGQPMLAHKATQGGRGRRRGHRRPQGRVRRARRSPPSSSPTRRSRRPASPRTRPKAKGRDGQGRQVPVRRARPRASPINDTDGFVKVVADAEHRARCSASTSSATAPRDLIAEAALAIEMGAVADDLRLTIHPHPTLSEAIMEAAAARARRGRPHHQHPGPEPQVSHRQRRGARPSRPPFLSYSPNHLPRPGGRGGRQAGVGA